MAANIYGAKADEILVRWDATLGFLFYKQDKQGSVTGLLNQNGTEVEKYSYDVFGKPIVTSRDLNSWAWKPSADRSDFGNRFLFTGREWIAELGIYDYRNRMYHPRLGRFLQVDPTGFDAGDMNLFRYVADDPLNQTDPTGLAGVGLTSWGKGLWVTGSDGINYEDRHWMGDNRDNDPHDHHSMGNGGTKSLDSTSEGQKAATPENGTRTTYRSMEARLAAGEDVQVVAGTTLIGPGGIARAGSLLRGLFTKIFGRSSTTITFKTAHVTEHLRKIGLPSARVERAVTADIRASSSGASRTGEFWGRVQVDGKTIEYRAYTLPNGTINVGTYYSP